MREVNNDISFGKLASIIENAISEVINNYEDNFKTVGNYDKELTDLLHELELGNKSYKENCKIATKIKNNRIERRKRKDIVENYSNLYHFLTTNNNIKTIKLFANELKRYVKLKEQMPKRTYVNRKG